MSEEETNIEVKDLKRYDDPYEVVKICLKWNRWASYNVRKQDEIEMCMYVLDVIGKENFNSMLNSLLDTEPYLHSVLERFHKMFRQIDVLDAYVEEKGGSKRDLGGLLDGLIHSIIDVSGELFKAIEEALRGTNRFAFEDGELSDMEVPR